MRFYRAKHVRMRSEVLLAYVVCPCRLSVCPSFCRCFCLRLPQNIIRIEYFSLKCSDITIFKTAAVCAILKF